MPRKADKPLAPVTLVTGSEELLVDRAVAEVVAAARAEEPATQTYDLVATEVDPGRLVELSSPSLFGERRVLVLRGVEAAGKAMAAATVELMRDPPEDVILVLVHSGGNRGRTLLDAATEVGARRVDCPAVKQYRDRLDFVTGEARRAGGTMTSDGARALLDAVGTDLRELAMACAQLVADTGGGPDGTVRIDAGVVARYYTGRAEATSFTVADRAVEGRTADALEQLRWALAVGVAPVLVTSALAQGVRSIARVRAAKSTRPADLARELGMPPWKVDRARKQARTWTDAAITASLHAVAEADAQVKGEAADASYALERAVVTVARAARG